MCYSAQIQADYRRYVKMFGAQMDIREFARLFWERAEGSKAKIPKAMEDAFLNPQNDDERQIKAFIDRYNAEQATSLEQELFRQRTRLADAQLGRVDPADAPRRALVIVVQIAVVLAVGIPIVAITQPFLPPHQGAFILTLLTLLLLVALWRNASNLQGHARAGAQIIASALAHQMASADGASSEGHLLEDVNAILPGLGEPVAIRVVPQSIAAGRSLAELNLRGATGATVLAIKRGDQQIPTPLGREVIQSGDMLAVAGSQDAISIARAIFTPDASRIRDDIQGAEIQAELEALNDALLAPSKRSTSLIP